MKEEDGTLRFGTAIDMSGFEEGMNNIEQKVSAIGDNVQSESARISEMLNHIPDVDINFITNASQSLSTIGQAFAQIDSVVDENKAAIRELEAEYERLSNVSATDDAEVQLLNQQKQAIQENIALRQQIIAEAEKTADALAQTEQGLRAESEAVVSSATTIREQLGAIGAECEKHEAVIAKLQQESQNLLSKMSKAYSSGDDSEYIKLKQKRDAIEKEISSRKKSLNELRKQSNALEQEASKIESTTNKTKTNTQETEKNTQKQASLRQRLRELKIELVEMEAAGMRGTEQYKALQEEAANLTDAWGDAQAQANILANDQRGMQGIISGLSGVSGAMSAAQGAVALFAGENEDLQKIMLKVQSLMAITMGLQQVQQTLNKDSAFTLVTLNGLKEWWNKLLAIGAGEQAAETATTVASTGAEVANTTATVANTAAKQANVAASTASTAATGANTAGQVVNTGAAVAGTAANIGLAGAFRMVGAAIKSIPVFGWIAAAIGAIISVISIFIDKANEASKELEENEKLLEEGRKAYAKASVEISDYITKIEKFNGTKEQEKKLVEELNQKYGSAMGYYESLEEWKIALTEKGEAYCNMLLKEAEAQAILNKYTEAFIHLQEVKDKAAAGEYDHWYNTKSGDEANRRKKIQEAEGEMTKWFERYKETMREAQTIRDNFDLNPHIDPKTITPKGGKGSGGIKFDAKAAAREYKKIYNEYINDIKSFIKDANAKITEQEIEASGEGLIRELNDIRYSTYQKEQAWKQQLRQLAEIRKNAIKEQYMTGKGHTEDTWEQTAESKKTIDDYVNELLYNADGTQTEIAKKYFEVLQGITEQGESQILKTRQKYYDEWVKEYGTTAQKIALLERQQITEMNSVPEEFRTAVFDAFERQMEQLKSADFKASINWEGVFGNLDEQSLSSLQYTLDKVQTYFKSAKNEMSTEEIKDFQEAIAKMENEIASRNPFAAFHKSLKDIGAAKTEFIDAMTSWRDAQLELTQRQAEYNDALQIKNDLQQQVDEGTLSEDSQTYKDAVDNLAAAQLNLNNATKKVNTEEQRTLNARNNLTSSYKSFATQLRNVGGVVKDLGGKAKNLAEAFGSDIAGGIGKSIDFIDEVFDATSDVISAIGDVGKNVAEGVSSTVEATSQGATAAAAAGASAISTIEKASVILAVISAALQIATAIANLFNDDEEKQKEIENLQRRIDQLQWELDNAEAVRIRDKYGDAQQKVIELYKEAEAEILKLHQATLQYYGSWATWIGRCIYQNEIMQKSIKKIADEYAKLDYTSDKALGSKKYDEARKQLENLAEQQILLQKQINEEDSKKKTDHGKIEEWQRQMQENAQEMVNIINEMVEDIIGYSAEDLAKELGDAFVEAFKEGEDAAQAWKEKVDDIVSDIIKRMMIQELLEKPIGSIFDKYRKKWFGDDGVFRGFDAVNGSMADFASELNALVDGFSASFDNLPEELKQYFLGDVEREGTSRGIATASQESVDENNARLTTIQEHTYTLVQGMGELNRTSSAILDKVTNIDKNTSEANTKLDTMSKSVKDIKDTVDDISTRGIKIKS